MKKTMFITSVIMVVVMAIALTTSSLAWFSASGTAQVTTNALSIQAKGTASSGLQISSTAYDSGWAKSIDLMASTDTYNQSMIPADMATYGYVLNYANADQTNGYGTGNYDDPATTDVTETLDAHAVASVLDALVGKKFISNNVDSDQKFENTTPVTDNTNGTANLYFAKTFWISSVATAAKKVQASCAFTSNGSTAYNYNSNDPTLYVAVIAAKNDTVVPDRDPANTLPNRDYEILNIFCSNPSATDVMLGASAAAYQNALVSSRGTPETIPATTGNKTSVALGAITQYYDDTAGANSGNAGKTQAFGSSREFQVIAWYDGATLTNTNSKVGNNNFELYFDLTFSAVD